MLAVASPVPPDDAVRCASVREWVVPAQQITELLDIMASEAAAFFGVPICLISLVDKNVQHFVGAFGLVPGLRETGRDVSFCAHAIMPDAPDVLSVDDASLDSRFSANPLVTGYPWIRFYAGAPLIHPKTRSRLGTLCIIDETPRHLRSEQGEHLQEGAAYVASVLDALARNVPLPQGRAAMQACLQQAESKRKTAAISPAAPISSVLATPARGASPSVAPLLRPVILVRSLKLENLALSSGQLHAALRRYCGQQGASVRAVEGEHCLRVLLPAHKASAEAEAANAFEMSLMIFQERPTGDEAASLVALRAEAKDGSSSTGARLHIRVRRLSGDVLAFGEFYRGMRTEIELS